MTRFITHFYGNKISDYGLENGHVDYKTFSQAFNAVLNNDIINKTYDIGYWEQESGWIDNADEIEELKEQAEELEYLINDDTPEEEETKLWEQIEEINRKIEELEEEQDDQPEIFQYYIIDDNGAEICKEFGEIVFYNETLDLYVWGVTHWGTAWDYVLTNIECEKPQDLPFKI